MKTFILASLLALTAVSGVVAASQTAEARGYHTMRCGMEFGYGYGWNGGFGYRYICRYY